MVDADNLRVTSSIYGSGLRIYVRQLEHQVVNSDAG